MSETQHERYIRLLTEFYDGRLKQTHYDELDNLHKMNIARVGMIVTGSKEEACHPLLA